jgi:SAM-dependent methyltransferase
MVSDEHPKHHHGSVRLDEAHWHASAAHTELEGDLLLAFVSETATWLTELRHADAPAVRRVIDIGSGPGVGTCELARIFPAAQVIAVDGSAAMLDRAAQRAERQGFDARVSTHHAELPGGLDELAPADVIWASMALHHVGDEVAMLRRLGDLLDAYGLLAIAERAAPTRVLPDDLDVGRPGLAARLADASEKWFGRMRDGLTDSVPSVELPSMVTSAGLEIVGSRVARVNLDPPLSESGRRFVAGFVAGSRERLDEYLDGDDLRALDVLSDAHDPRGVSRRSDVFISASRQIVIARRIGAR